MTTSNNKVLASSRSPVRAAVDASWTVGDLPDENAKPVREALEKPPNFNRAGVIDKRRRRGTGIDEIRRFVRSAASVETLQVEHAPNQLDAPGHPLGQNEREPDGFGNSRFRAKAASLLA